MDLFCPHCTKRVSVPDDKAGLVMSCPLCAKQFMAPSLAPPPQPAPKPAPPPSPPPVQSYGVDPAAMTPTVSMPSPPSRPPPPPPPPPLPPGEYTRSFTCSLNGNWLAFVTPACLAAIFILSFFPWHLARPALNMVPLSLWELAITGGQGHFLGYLLLTAVCFPLSVAALIFDKKWAPAPPGLGAFLLFKNLIVGLLLALAFLFVLYDYAEAHLIQTTGNPLAVAMKIAVRLHLVAILACFGMFWLHWRTQKNLPLPKCEIRW